MSTTAPAPAGLEAFCERYLAAWNDHAAAAIADLVTEDVVWEDPALPAPAHGPAFYDFNALAVQLGLAPAPGSRIEKALAALQRLGAEAAARRRSR